MFFIRESDACGEIVKINFVMNHDVRFVMMRNDCFDIFWSDSYLVSRHPLRVWWWISPTFWSWILFSYVLNGLNCQIHANPPLLAILVMWCEPQSRTSCPNCPRSKLMSLFLGRKIDALELWMIHHTLKAEVIREMITSKCVCVCVCVCGVVWLGMCVGHVCVWRVGR